MKLKQHHKRVENESQRTIAPAIAWRPPQRIVFRNRAPQSEDFISEHARDSNDQDLHSGRSRHFLLTSSLISEQARIISKPDDHGNYPQPGTIVVLIHKHGDEQKDVYLLPQSQESNLSDTMMLWDDDMLNQISSHLTPDLTLPAINDLQFKSSNQAQDWSCYTVQVEQGAFGPDEECDVMFPNLLTTQDLGQGEAKRSTHNVGSLEFLLEWLAEPTRERIETHLSNLIKHGIQSSHNYDWSGMRDPSELGVMDQSRKWSGSWCYERLRSSWGKETLDRMGITVKSVTKSCIDQIDSLL